jgi:histone H3/H4
MAEISSAPVKRLLVAASGEMRVGASALNLAVEAIEDFTRRLGAAAAQHAAADKRKTIQDSDIAHARAELGKSSADPEKSDPQTEDQA